MQPHLISLLLPQWHHKKINLKLFEIYQFGVGEEGI